MQTSSTPILSIFTTRGFVAAVGIFAASVSAQAGLVTWSAPTGIAGDSDVSTHGSLVMAYRFGAPGTTAVTVNGVNFQPFAVDGTSMSVTVGSARYSTTSDAFLQSTTTSTWQTLTPAYTSLISSAAWWSADRTYTLRMSGLVVGQKYEFQTWGNDSNKSPFQVLFTNTLDDGMGDSVDIYRGDNGGGGPGVPGQFVIGTFVADATFQDISFTPTEISEPVNAFQLRQIFAPVPEPGTALFGLGLAVVSTLARRRRTV